MSAIATHLQNDTEIMSLLTFGIKNKFKIIVLMILTTFMNVVSDHTFLAKSTVLSKRFFCMVIMDSLIVLVSSLLVWQKDSMKSILSYLLQYITSIIHYNVDTRHDIIRRAYQLNKKFVNPNSECVICAESMQNRVNICLLQCGHCYHGQCLTEWEFQQKNKWQLHYECPLCRAPYSTFQRFDYNYCIDICSKYDQMDVYNMERIHNYQEFGEKYGFIHRNGSRRILLGTGRRSVVYKVYLLLDKTQKYVAKITSYTNNRNKCNMMKKHRLLHEFGNGIYLKDIYDDVLKQRMVFIMPIGIDLSVWWNRVKRKFIAESVVQQEWIIKKILYELLLNVSDIHSAGYIHCNINSQNILVTKNTQCNINEDWITRYSFDIISYGSSVRYRHRYNKRLVDLDALGMTICELIMTISCRNKNVLSMRSLIKSELIRTPYTTGFKDFILNLFRNNGKRRIASINDAINDDFFNGIC